MAWYLLTRMDAMLVSVELSNGDEVVLLFDDRNEALAVGTVIDRESPVDPLGIVELAVPGHQVGKSIAEYTGIRSDLRKLKPLLPDDPLHRHLVRAILRR
jgi:hypothetical protein